VQRLFDDDALLRSKLLEECEELLAAKDNKEVRVMAWLCLHSDFARESLRCTFLMISCGWLTCHVTWLSTHECQCRLLACVSTMFRYMRAYSRQAR
jgi:hypothetical protein